MKPKINRAGNKKESNAFDRCNTPAYARGAIAPTLSQLGYRGQLHIALQDEPLPAIAVSRGGVQLRLAL